MTKKIPRADDWITASVAAQLLSAKCGFPVSPEYIAPLSRSKKQPIKTRAVSGHLLYYRPEIERCIVKKRQTKQE